MIDKPTFSHTVGITLQKAGLKAASLSMRKGKPFVEKVTTLAFEQDHVNPLYIQEITSSSKNGIVVTGLDTSEILVRPLEVKLTKDKDIDAVYLFQSEPLLPYPLDQAVVDKMQISKTEQGTQLSIIAARKDYLQRHLDKWKTVELEPEVVSSVPAALSTFAYEYFPSANPLYIIDIGRDVISCVLSKEGKLLGAYALQMGSTHLIEAFAKDIQKPLEEAELEFAQLNLEQLNPADYPHFSEKLSEVKRGILKSCFALSKYAKGKEIEEVLLTGNVGNNDSLPSFLCEGLNKKMLFAAQESRDYAVEIGLALSGLPTCKDQINFRQQDYAYSNPWKRYKKPAALYIALCVLLALAIHFAGDAWLGHREDKLKEEYGEMLNLMNKPYDAFEQEYEKKHPHSNPKGNGEILTLKELSQEDLQGRLSYLEKELQNTPETYPLQPNTARVSDVLAWLTSHPNVVMKGEKGAEPKLQIESFNYVMVKRPELSKKQEKYQVKIDLELSSPTPMLAREFHDALIAPNNFVDPKGEIKWSSNRGKYRTSFYLKDKTVYPF